MIRRLFTLAAAISLVLCVFCAWAGLSYLAFWRHGVIAVVNGKEQVVHELSDERDATTYAILAILFAILPLVRLSVHIQGRWGEFNERKLLTSGRCGMCGYDLRAGTDRCPECGTTIPQKTEARA